MAEAAVGGAHRGERTGDQQPLPGARRPMALERVGAFTGAQAPQTIAQRGRRLADGQNTGELTTAQSSST